MSNDNGWTQERRRQQRARIMRVRPWEHSTGPRTVAGKAKSSQNARRPADLSAVENYLALLKRRRVY